MSLSFGRLDELLYQPLTTPQQWCEGRPCVSLGGIVFNEPLGSFLVFLLAFLWIGAGVHFARDHRGQRSRWWLALALILGGVGAAQAGISYQLLSYTLKCAGRTHCILTNGFEVGYSVTQALSVSAMLIAAAYACARGHLQTALFAYSLVNAVVYVAVAAVGVMLPSAMLLSFEVLTVFALPGIFVVIGIAGGTEGRALRMAAVFLLVVQVAYFSYAAAGITALLWRNGDGFYFSENDVLHIGMIAWLLYVVTSVGRDLRDLEKVSANRA